MSLLKSYISKPIAKLLSFRSEYAALRRKKKNLQWWCSLWIWKKWSVLSAIFFFSCFDSLPFPFFPAFGGSLNGFALGVVVTFGFGFSFGAVTAFVDFAFVADFVTACETFARGTPFGDVAAPFGGLAVPTDLQTRTLKLNTSTAYVTSDKSVNKKNWNLYFECPYYMTPPHPLTTRLQTFEAISEELKLIRNRDTDDQIFEWKPINEKYKLHWARASFAVCRWWCGHWINRRVTPGAVCVRNDIPARVGFSK